MEQSNARSAKRTQYIAFIGVMTAVICIMSPISIPIPVSPVPITLGSLAIFITLYALGMKAGTISYLCYLVIGLIGLPVFSGFMGGAGRLVGPTGGYLIGFIFLSIVSGYIMDRFPGKRLIEIAGMIFGTLICYAFGSAWLAVQNNISFIAALGIGAIPYIPVDAVKIIAASLIGPPLRNAINQQRNRI